MRLALAVLAMAACGPKAGTGQESSPVVPTRPATAGDRIYPLAPAGADAVLELDLARLRRNRAVGPLVRAVTAGGLARPDVIASADLLVICSYRVGEPDAGQIAFAAGPDVGKLPGARRLAADLVATGPAALLDQIEMVRFGATPPLSRDLALLRVRALAMPEKARGASLRVSARLGFEARLALARRLEVDSMPAWLSVWADVADDLAAVALFGGDGAGEAQDLAFAAGRVRDRVARSRRARRLGLDRLVGGTSIDVRGEEARVVMVVGPRRLARLIDRVMARLRAGDESSGERTGE
jgi:hypothetical protein